ncbi:MAG: SCO family protein [Planctomycetes bacterium]|nr:SCO family protein [Planctomycetota bacterium]
MSNASLRGSVWIANFFFTQCTSICPGMTAKMVLLQTSLSGLDLEFVSFSVDPDHDTPDILARYAQDWNPGESRWRLLSTTPDGLARTAAGMKVSVQATDDVKDPILHSNRFLLVDAEGRVRGAYDSSDDGSLEQLVLHARHLVGDERGAAASGDALAALDGKSLFSALGCAACHGDVRLAPPLGGLLGARVPLEGGTSVIADAAYLEQSIVDPWALLVAGYGPTMPNYRAHLNADRLRALVEFVGAGELPGKSGARAESLATEQAVDPVCKMKVTVTAETPSAVVGGHTTWFCCEYCRDRFLTDPKFQSPAGAGEAKDGQSATSQSQPRIDPVCKMEVEVNADTPSSIFEGRTYWFCCDFCRESFAADPRAFGPGAPSLFERPAQPAAEPAGGEWAALSPTEHVPVAFVLDAGAEVVDFSGPWGVFLYAHVEGRQDSPFQMYVVAETTEPIRLSGGLQVVPDHSFDSAPQPRIIVVPALGNELRRLCSSGSGEPRGRRI